MHVAQATHEAVFMYHCGELVHSAWLPLCEVLVALCASRNIDEGTPRSHTLPKAGCALEHASLYLR